MQQLYSSCNSLFNFHQAWNTMLGNILPNKVLMQGKLFQRCAHFFVLQCTVFWRKSKHKTDITAWHGINFHKNNLWNILVYRKLLCELSKVSKLNAFNNLSVCLVSVKKIPHFVYYNLFTWKNLLRNQNLIRKVVNMYNYKRWSLYKKFKTFWSSQKLLNKVSHD